MKILDRYILLLFITSYLICLFTLVSLYVVIDFFEKSEEFHEYLDMAQQVMGKAGKKADSPFIFYLHYYLCHLPMIFIRISPAITLMASVFTFTRLMKANELIPLKASGISIYRIMLPVFFCGFLLALVQISMQEYVLPKLSVKINEASKIDKMDLEFDQWIQRFDQRGSVVFTERYYPHLRKMEQVTISRFQNLSSLAPEHQIPQKEKQEGEKEENDEFLIETETISAKQGQLVQREDQCFFVLEEVYIFKYNSAFECLEGYPLYQKHLEIPTTLQPYQMIGSQSQGHFDTFSELLKKREKNPDIYSIQVALHTHFTLALANLIFLMLGLPLVILKETKTFFIGIGVCILVSALYFTTNLIFIHLGNQGLLQPAVAAWFPVIFFGALGAVILNMMET